MSWGGWRETRSTPSDQRKEDGMKWREGAREEMRERERESGSSERATTDGTKRWLQFPKSTLGDRGKERRKTGKGKTDSRRESRSVEPGVPSVLLTVLGLKGGGISSLSRRSQSIQRKNGCSLISRSASTPAPSRLAGCFVRSLDTSDKWEKGKEKNHSE